MAKNSYYNDTIKRIYCAITDYESWDLFIGLSLNRYIDNKLFNENTIIKFRDSIKFYNEVTLELNNFLNEYEYNILNLESWFNKNICIFSWIKKCTSKIDVTPKTFQNTVYFLDMRSYISRSTKQDKNAEIWLLRNVTKSNILCGLKGQGSIQLQLSDIFYLQDIDTELKEIKPSLIRATETRLQINIKLYTGNRRNLQQLYAPRDDTKYTKTIHLITNDEEKFNNDVSLYELQLITDAKLISQSSCYICNSETSCRYKTKSKFAYERHRKTCSSVEEKVTTKLK